MPQFKTSPDAQPLKWKWVAFCSYANQTHFPYNSWASRLTLKPRQTATQKWPIWTFVQTPEVHAFRGLFLKPLNKLTGWVLQDLKPMVLFKGTSISSLLFHKRQVSLLPFFNLDFLRCSFFFCRSLFFSPFIFPCSSIFLLPITRIFLFFLIFFRLIFWLTLGLKTNF